MPIIDIPVDQLMTHLNRGQPAGTSLLSEAEMATLLPRIGCAIEEIAEMHQYACKRCDKIFDRTQAQGLPLNCTHCGTDFRAQAALLADMGKNRVFRFELLAVRTDIYDPGGMARLLRGYLGVQTGLTHYELSDAKISVTVDPKLADDRSRRPFISCAVLRNVTLDHALIKMLMNLQEDLHWALGRDRKLASIGVYDLDVLSGTKFRYDAIKPDEVRFVPLGFSPDDPAAKLTPAQILEKHATGRDYAHLLKNFTAYPLLRDEAGTVLSMPPIINSESTRVTMKSRNLFVDVTGLSQRVVDRALNVLVTSLKELLPRIQIERVSIHSAEGTRQTPDLAPTAMDLNVRETAETIGATIDESKLSQLLMRMGHGVASGPAGAVTVHVPAYRNDIMHPVDLIEDAAIAYGYDNLNPTLVPTFTVGGARRVEEQAALTRKAFTGMGFHQVMTLVLTSEPAAFTKWRMTGDDPLTQQVLPRAVRIENPISTEQTIARLSLLPGLLETLALNKEHDLPQQIFEVGDVCFLDPTVETGAREERCVGAAMIGTHVGYADARAVVDAFMREFALAPGAGYRIETPAACDPRFIPGRVAAILDRRGRRIGTMGEVHPEVLENYGLQHATAVMEWSLEQLLEE